VLEALLDLWWLKHHLRGPLERSRAVCPASLPVGNANFVLATVPTCNSPKRKKYVHRVPQVKGPKLLPLLRGNTE
jgi:hypothetical protein